MKYSNISLKKKKRVQTKGIWCKCAREGAFKAMALLRFKYGSFHHWVH
jgi:hypothetical protein